MPVTRAQRIEKARRARDQLDSAIVRAIRAEAHTYGRHDPGRVPESAWRELEAAWAAVETLGGSLKRQGRILAGKSWGTAHPGTTTPTEED